MSLPVELTPAARSDLREIKDWYEAQRPGLGRRFAARATAVVETLGVFPQLFAVVWKHVRAAPIRRHPHVVYYCVYSDRVEIIAVMHGSRDASSWQDRVSDSSGPED